MSQPPQSQQVRPPAVAGLFYPAEPTRLADGRTLAALLASDPDRLLGEDVVRRFGPQLPFLLKVIAPDRALSLQVHPSLEQAARGFEQENAEGVVPNSPVRN